MRRRRKTGFATVPTLTACVRSPWSASSSITPFQGLRPAALPASTFFVLSGFLISGLIFKQLDGARFRFSEFYAHRVRRIFPALTLVLIASWLLAWNFLAPGDFLKFARSLLGGVGFYANFTNIGEDYFQALGADSLLLHLWSLGIEEQFYLVWPLLVWFVWRSAPKALAPTIAVIAVTSFADNLVRTHAAPITAFFYPDARLWELAIGGGLAFATAQGEALPWLWRTWLSAAGAVMLLISVFLLNGSLAWPGWWASVPTVGTIAMLAAGPEVWINRRILAARLPVAIGKISYPWYLWHWPLLLAGRMALWRVPQGWIDGLMVAASLALATATYKWVERPIRFGKAGRIRTLGPLLAMLLPAILAGAVFAAKGFPDRFPHDLQIILGARETSRDQDRKFHYARCFDATDKPTPIDPGACIDAKTSAADHRPLIFLWGDSHAFSLYPGLRMAQQQRKDFRLAFFAKGSCPFFATPGRTWSAGGCAAFNAQVKKQIAQMKPDIVVLGAFWANTQYFGGGPLDPQTVRNALLALQGEGIARVVVVGTVPVWLVPQPTVIAREWRRNAGVIPQYSANGLNASTYVAEKAVREAVAGTRAVYVPLLDGLCDKQGCLLMADRKNGDPLELDGWHLTKAGSQLVARMILPQILGAH